MSGHPATRRRQHLAVDQRKRGEVDKFNSLFDGYDK